MKNRISLKLLVILLLSLTCVSVRAQNKSSALRRQQDSRLLQLVEANIVGTHAFQVLLVKQSGKGDPNCFASDRLSDSDLNALVAHQAKLLKSDANAEKGWGRGR